MRKETETPRAGRIVLASHGVDSSSERAQHACKENSLTQLDLGSSGVEIRKWERGNESAHQKLTAIHPEYALFVGAFARRLARAGH